MEKNKNSKLKYDKLIELSDYYFFICFLKDYETSKKLGLASPWYTNFNFHNRENEKLKIMQKNNFSETTFDYIVGAVANYDFNDKDKNNRLFKFMCQETKRIKNTVSTLQFDANNPLCIKRLGDMCVALIDYGEEELYKSWDKYQIDFNSDNHKNKLKQHLKLKGN